jgi:hypothetical protein
VKENKMHTIAVRCGAAIRFGLVLLLMFGANGCAKQPKIAKKTKAVPCDTTINADPSTGGVDLQAAFLCENDMVTWQVPTGHHFHVEFTAGSPFVKGKSRFDDQDPSGKVKDLYQRLEVYKYQITVDSRPTVDPQVVGGGNP